MDEIRKGFCISIVLHLLLLRVFFVLSLPAQYHASTSLYLEEGVFYLVGKHQFQVMYLLRALNKGTLFQIAS